MKFSTAIISFVCATLASARSVGQTPLQADPIANDLKVPGQNPLTYCLEPSNYILKIDSVDLSPNPPKAGTKLIISASGNVGEEVVDGAKVKILVKYLGLITVLDTTADLCENLPKIDINCPLKKGPLKIYREADLPAVIPPGKYNVDASIITKDGKEALCLKAEVEFHAHV